MSYAINCSIFRIEENLHTGMSVVGEFVRDGITMVKIAVSPKDLCIDGMRFVGTMKGPLPEIVHLETPKVKEKYTVTIPCSNGSLSVTQDTLAGALESAVSHAIDTGWKPERYWEFWKPSCPKEIFEEYQRQCG